MTPPIGITEGRKFPVTVGQIEALAMRKMDGKYNDEEKCVAEHSSPHRMVYTIVGDG